MKKSDQLEQLEQIKLDLVALQDELSINKKSIDFAKMFIDNSIIPYKFGVPVVEIHPDKLVSFTWSKALKGYFNICFDETGIASWAAMIELTNQNKILKGCFKVQNTAPPSARDIIILIAGDKKC